MGFLSRLFGRNDCSANYYISCNTLKYVFYQGDPSVESFYDDLELAKALLAVAIEMAKKSGVKVPKSYANLPVSFVSNEDRSIFGYIFSFDDAKYECECNFVGMMIENGKRCYYTSEYCASDNSFALCMFSSDGRHYFGIGDSNPKSYEEFKKAVVG